MSKNIDRFFRVLSIAGSDSGGGAGIQADLKTFSALGCYGMTAITALTSQNTVQVRSVHSVPPSILRDQIDMVIEDIGADAIKIGMLHEAITVRTVSDALDRHQLENVVLDPVMVATNGAVLIHHQAVSLLVSELFPKAVIVTPNLDEAAVLVGRPLRTEPDMEFAACELVGKGAKAVLVKGGHLPGDLVCDFFLTDTGESFWLRFPRIKTDNTHGTGCTLSSAIAAYLALGLDLPSSVKSAHAFVRGAIAAGSTVRTGSGSGPLNHGYSPQAMHLKPLI